jgi:hypothetical protein
MGLDIQPVVKQVSSVWTKIVDFIKKMNFLHWAVGILSIILVIGGIYAFIQFKNLFVNNSALVKQLDTLRRTNLDISADARILAGQLKQGDNFIKQLQRYNSGLKTSLDASKSDNAKLADDNSRLKQQIDNSTGFTDIIQSNNTEANGLIKSVSGSISKALGQNSESGSTDRPSN